MNFGDWLTNALHDIKGHTGKKIGILHDEIGYACTPEVSGANVEKWRARSAPTSYQNLEQLAKIIHSYKVPQHDWAWMFNFLKESGHPHPEAICSDIFQTRREPQIQAAYQPLEFPPPPLEAYQPITVPGFVGRESELNHFQNELDEQGVAFVIGMAGVGKSSLAAILASQRGKPDHSFWHRFNDSGLSPFIRRLAGFLAHHEQATLWEMLETARLSGVKPPESETAFDILWAGLSRSRTPLLLCLDDLQFVDDYPLFQNFVSQLIDSRPQSVEVIITSRRHPAFLRRSATAALSGLNPLDTQMLLSDRQVTLDQSLSAQLHTLTEGNAAFLTLALVALRLAADPADLIGQLERVSDVERFLLEEVNDRLESNEQRVMEAIATLGGYPGSRDVIGFMLNRRDVGRTLQSLSDQYLLQIDPAPAEKQYSQHHILQRFYATVPLRAQQRALHARAALFYSSEEEDHFKAIFHFAGAGEVDRVASVANSQLWPIVNTGMAQPLNEILNDIDTEQIPDLLQVEFWLTQGRLNQLLGEADAAQALYSQVKEALQRLPENRETDILKGRTCLHMAELLERQSPAEAQEWVLRGLEVTPRDERSLLVELKTFDGTLKMHTGNMGNALESFLDAQEELASDADPDLTGNLLTNLGTVYWMMGDLETATRYTDQALKLSRANKAHNRTAQTLGNAGPIRYLSGDWTGATEALEEGYEIAVRLGNRNSMAAISINLGGCLLQMGRDEEAGDYLKKGLALTAAELPQMEIAVRIRLSKLAYYQEAFETGIEHLNRAELLAQALNSQNDLASIYLNRAELYLLPPDLAESERWVAEAAKQAKMVGNQISMMEIERFWGRLLCLKAAYLESEARLQRSLSLINDKMSFEAALSYIELGKLNIVLEKEESAREWLEKAYPIVLKLGAQRELQAIAALW